MNEHEKKGRDIFKKLIDSKCYDFNFSNEEFSSWDVMFISGITSIAAEIKNRDIPSTIQYKDGNGFILEKTKYDGLKKLGLDRSIFFTIFTDQMVGWDITDMNPEWQQKLYSSDRFRRRKIMKTLTYLHLTGATYFYDRTGNT